MYVCLSMFVYTYISMSMNLLHSGLEILNILNKAHTKSDDDSDNLPSMDYVPGKLTTLFPLILTTPL